MAVNGNIILVSLLVPKRELTDAETPTAKSRVSMNVEMFGNISVLLSMLLSQGLKLFLSSMKCAYREKALRDRTALFVFPQGLLHASEKCNDIFPKELREDADIPHIQTA